MTEGERRHCLDRSVVTCEAVTRSRVLRAGASRADGTQLVSTQAEGPRLTLGAQGPRNGVRRRESLGGGCRARWESWAHRAFCRAGGPLGGWVGACFLPGV